MNDETKLHQIFSLRIRNKKTTILFLTSLIALLGFAPTAAFGQSLSETPTSPSRFSLQRWSAEGELTLSPSFGKSIEETSAATVDDSEYEAAIRLRGPLDSLGGMRLQLQAGVTYSPNWDTDPSESAYYGEIQLGDTYIAPRRLLRGDFGTVASDTEPAIRPFGRIRHSRVEKNFLGSRQRDDTQATIGLRYRRAPYVLENDRSVRGMYFEIRAEVSRIWSTDRDERLWNPKVQFDVYSKPLARSLRLLARVSYEVNFFSEKRVPAELRQDGRLRVTAGADLSQLAARVFGSENVSVEILGRYQGRWSNDPTGDHQRGYFVPSISLTLPFG